MFYRYTDNGFINIYNIKKIQKYDIYNNFWKIYMIDGEEIIVDEEDINYLLKNNIINSKPERIDKNG